MDEQSSLADFLAAEGSRLASACTACGKCVEVCPVVPFAGLQGSEPPAIVSGVLGLLREGTPPSGEAMAWMRQCNGCGDCIPACPEQINPRRMLVLANTLRPHDGTKETPQLFRKMARAIRLMVGMQLLPAEFSRLLDTPRRRDVPMVFYLGCNALRTPHLLFNAMHILDALEADYEVVGGPASCCGVIQSRWEGELGASQRIVNTTINRFEGFRPDKVLSWCPSCNLHLGETLSGYRATTFELGHFTGYLVERLDALRSRMVRSLNRRVVLHAHTGLAEFGRNVAAVLAAIPGLTVAETVFESGYACGGAGCARSPKLQSLEHAQLLDRVRMQQADTLATFYHNCHAAFVTAEKQDGFRVVNFTDLIVEALGGVPHDDVLKRYRLADDAKLIVEEGMPLLRANGIELEPDFLERILNDLFRMAEFQGGLDCFASAGGPPPAD